MRHSRKSALTGLWLLALFASAAPVEAQRPAAVPRRIPVTVALVDELPAAQRPYALLRRAPAEGGDVILLEAGADADQLSNAVRALLTVRRQQGDQAAERATLRVTGSMARRPALPWAARVLADARRGPARALLGVGTARSVVIWLPPHQIRSTVPGAGRRPGSPGAG